MKITVHEMFEKYKDIIGLTPTKSKHNMDRLVKVSHVQRPGLSLAGYVRRKLDNRILLFGRVELNYLKDLEPELRQKRLNGVITKSGSYCLKRSFTT